jgi:hypothetical protein
MASGARSTVAERKGPGVRRRRRPTVTIEDPSNLGAFARSIKALTSACLTLKLVHPE